MKKPSVLLFLFFLTHSSFLRANFVIKNSFAFPNGSHFLSFHKKDQTAEVITLLPSRQKQDLIFSLFNNRAQLLSNKKYSLHKDESLLTHSVAEDLSASFLTKTSSVFALHHFDENNTHLWTHNYSSAPKVLFTGQHHVYLIQMLNDTAFLKAFQKTSGALAWETPLPQFKEMEVLEMKITESQDHVFLALAEEDGSFSTHEINGLLLIKIEKLRGAVIWSQLFNAAPNYHDESVVSIKSNLKGKLSVIGAVAPGMIRSLFLAHFSETGELLNQETVYRLGGGVSAFHFKKLDHDSEGSPVVYANHTDFYNVNDEKTTDRIFYGKMLGNQFIEDHPSDPDYKDKDIEENGITFREGKNRTSFILTKDLEGYFLLKLDGLTTGILWKKPLPTGFIPFNFFQMKEKNYLFLSEDLNWGQKSLFISHIKEDSSP